MDLHTEQRNAAWAAKRALESFPGSCSRDEGVMWVSVRTPAHRANPTLDSGRALDVLRRAELWLADLGHVVSLSPWAMWWCYDQAGFRFRGCVNPFDPDQADIEVAVEIEAPASRTVTAVTIRRLA